MTPNLPNSEGKMEKWLLAGLIRWRSCAPSSLRSQQHAMLETGNNKYVFNLAWTSMACLDCLPGVQCECPANDETQSETDNSFFALYHCEAQKLDVVWPSQSPEPRAKSPEPRAQNPTRFARSFLLQGLL